MSATIRLARPDEAALLPPIERSAGESVRTIAGFESWADAETSRAGAGGGARSLERLRLMNLSPLARGEVKGQI